MKTKYFLGIAAALCFLPISAHAECSSERIAELNKIANNVNLSYTYEFDKTVPDDGGKSEIMAALFSTHISNLTNDIYIENTETGNTHVGTGETTDPTKFESGKSITYTIYSNDPNCKGQSLTSKYITFPKFNEYSTFDECEEYPDFKYCKTWLDTSNLNVDDFNAALEKYKNGNKSDISKAKKNKVNFFDEYKFLIIGLGTILVIGIIAFVVIKIVKRRKGQDLL